MTALEFLKSNKIIKNECSGFVISFEDGREVELVELLNGFAKNMVELNFCDGKSTDFNELSIKDLKDTHEKINNLVDWVNS